MNKIEAKVAKLSTSMLQEMVPTLFASDADGSEIVLSAVLAQLEKRLPEAEFVAMCEAL